MMRTCKELKDKAKGSFTANYWKSVLVALVLVVVIGDIGFSICKRIADMRGFSLSIPQPYGHFTKTFVLQYPLCE